MILAIALATAPAAAVAQGTVSGRVTIQEKPGERTSDLENAVVWLVPASGAGRVGAPTAAEIVMQARQFRPRVRLVTAGAEVTFPNQDPFSHNIFSNQPTATFDLGLYGKGQSKGTVFKRAGVYPVYCNIHPRMSAYVIALDTPHRAQAGADGRFTIDGVPAGNYVLHVWHERAPQLSRPVTVAAGGLAVPDVALDATGFKLVQHLNKFGKPYTSGNVRY
jgi:plastocyanin